MELYTGDTIANFLKSKREELKNRIYSESENYILNIGEVQYIQHLKSQFIIGFPEIDTRNAYVDTYEADIPASRFPIEFYISNRNQSIKKNVIVYYVPYSGNISILRFKPNIFSNSHLLELNIDPKLSVIKFEFINFYDDAEKIKNAYQSHLNALFSCYGYLRSEIESYNNNLESAIRTILGASKDANSKKE